MRLSVRHAVLLMVVPVLLAGAISRSAESPTDPTASDKQSQWPLAGTWHAISLSMSLDDGKRRTITDEDGAVSVVLSDKSFTLRLGVTILLSTKCKTDRKPRLYLFGVAGGKPPKLFPGIPADWSCSGPAWLPGGKKVVFSAVPPLQPVKPN